MRGTDRSFGNLGDKKIRHSIKLILRVTCCMAPNRPRISQKPIKTNKRLKVRDIHWKRMIITFLLLPWKLHIFPTIQILIFSLFAICTSPTIHLVYPPPPKFCISIVFNVSWDSWSIRGNKKKLCKILREVQNGESRNAITTLPLRYKGNRLIELGLPVVKHSVIDLRKNLSWPTLIINRVSLTRTDAELENIIVTFVFPLSDK